MTFGDGSNLQKIQSTTSIVRYNVLYTLKVVCTVWQCNALQQSYTISDYSLPQQQYQEL